MEVAPASAQLQLLDKVSDAAKLALPLKGCFPGGWDGGSGGSLGTVELECLNELGSGAPGPSANQAFNLRGYKDSTYSH